MKISYAWLKRFLDLEVTAEELERVLPLIGFEVDSVEVVGVPPLEKVVVGKVLKKDQHPDADRLSVCEVQVGEDADDVRQIVCGAQNFTEGDYVPVALIGAKLPGGIKIKKSKLRGVQSKGMMCAGSEIGVADEEKGLLILGDKPAVGTPINDVFEPGDHVLDIELTANRGDCASHVGIAREIASYYGLELNMPELLVSTSDNSGKFQGVDIQSEACPYYAGWVLEDVNVSESPAWLKKDLEAIGLRPVNAVVDITNWVMMELGQPMHAFDAEKLTGDRLVVRQAADGEKIEALDEKTYELNSTMTVIADEKQAVAIAGVMGGASVEVDHSTKTVVLESAFFNPGRVRATSRALNLHSDSSYRFARTVDPEMIDFAGNRAVEMILEHCGGKLAKEFAQGEKPNFDHSIDLAGKFVRETLGFDVSDEEIESVLTRLGFRLNGENGSWKVDVPSYRHEVKRRIDLVEEVVRIVSTERLGKVSFEANSLHRKNDPISVFNHKVSDFLSAQGFYECVNYSLVQGDEEGLKLDNPLTADHTHVRDSLIPGLVENLLHNQNHGQDLNKVFETGRVFRSVDGEMSEFCSVAFAATLSNKDVWIRRESSDFYSAKALLEEVCKFGKWNSEPYVAYGDTRWQEGHSGRSGERAVAGLLNLAWTKQLGLDSKVLAGEFLVRLEDFKASVDTRRFEPYSAYPGVEKDLSLVVDKELPAGQLQARVVELTREMLNGNFELLSSDVFDVYVGQGVAEGKKSIAIRLGYGSQERTLSDAEVNDVYTKTLDALEASGFEVRK